MSRPLTSSPKSSARTPRPRCRLRLEFLEAREVPATLINVGANNALPDAPAAAVLGMSLDGSKVIFSSAATNLVAGQQDAPGTPDLFWRDLATGATQLVSRSVANSMISGRPVATGTFTGEAALSADGTKVAFVDTRNAFDLTLRFASSIDASNTPDVFRWDANSPSAPMQLVSIDSGVNATGLVVNDYAAGNLGSGVHKMRPAISSDGRFIAYQTTRAAYDMDQGLSWSTMIDDGNSTYDVFVYDSANASDPAKRTKLVDVAGLSGSSTAQGANPANRLGEFAISGDGRFVAYASTAYAPGVDTSVTNDASGGSATLDVFVRDVTLPSLNLAGNDSRLVTRDAGKPSWAAGTAAFVLSDGVEVARLNSGTRMTLVYRSTSSELVGGYTGLAGSGAQHLYRTVFDFANPTAPATQLVDQTTAGPASPPVQVGVNDFGTAGYSVSADGTRVAFTSAAANLAPGVADANNAADVFVRDFSANKTVAVSVTPAGDATGNGASTGARISDNGAAVAFTSTATNLVAGLTDSNGAGRDVFARDLAAGKTSAASRAPGTRHTGDGESFAPFVGVDAGGTARVAFTSKATDLLAGQLIAPSSGAALLATIPPGGDVLPPEVQPGGAALHLPKAVGISGSADGQAQTFGFDANGQLVPAGGPVAPFAGFAGDVRTAVADVDGDGQADTVYGVGPGGGSAIRVVTSTGVDVSTTVYESSFTGGVFLAAGDIDGDGKAEIVVSPDQGGGGRVVVFKLQGNQLVRIADFFGIDDPNFRGGARVAVGDVNGDGTPDVIVAAGFGGGPRVAIFDGRSVLGNGNSPGKLLGDFFVFEPTLRNGVYVGAGDFDADGKSDPVFGGGPGGGPRVFVLSGARVAAGDVEGAKNAPLANFFAGDTAQRGGIRVAAKDIDGDNLADLVTGSGEGFPAHVRTYAGKAVQATGGQGEPALLQDFPAFGGGASAAGVFVG